MSVSKSIFLQINFIFEQIMNYLLKSIFFFAVITLLSKDLKAQSKIQNFKNITIRGTVYEKETGEPSFGTNVKIKGTGIGSSTDLNGFFQINRLSPGKITLEISNIEFKTIEKEIELEENKKIVTINFFMEENDEVLMNLNTAQKQKKNRSKNVYNNSYT